MQSSVFQPARYRVSMGSGVSVLVCGLSGGFQRLGVEKKRHDAHEGDAVAVCPGLFEIHFKTRMSYQISPPGSMGILNFRASAHKFKVLWRIIGLQRVHSRDVVTLSETVGTLKGRQ